MMTDITLKAQEEITFFDVADETLEIEGARQTPTRASPLVLARAYLSVPVCRPNWPFSERPPRGGLSVSTTEHYFLSIVAGRASSAHRRRKNCATRLPKSLDLARDTNADIGQ